ncbi:polysaccharide export protein [Marinomonas agarivorans]|nr:polysaccharide export protein [Marinomonas agarivorans]
MQYIVVFILSLLISTSSYADEEYKLKAGDSISIHVYGEDDLDLITKLDESGLIRYPFIGEVNVLDKSVRQVANLIVKGLQDGYFVDPDVHVSIVEYRPFYIHGQVKKPGAFPYRPNITVSMGIALAGGLTERASSNWILQKSGTEQEIKVDGDQLIFPGDILIIKQSFF